MNKHSLGQHTSPNIKVVDGLDAASISKPLAIFFFLCGIMEMRNIFFLTLILLINLVEAQDNHMQTVPIHVGVILDMQTWVAKVSNSCMYMAISDFYDIHPHYKTRLLLHTRDSTSDVIGAAFAAMDLLKNVTVQAIIGPQKSEQTEFIVDVGHKLRIPIISFSATSPSIYSRSPYFIRTTPDDHTQVKAIASIAEAFKWRKAILVHEDSDYGNRLVPHLINAFQETNTRISYRASISPSATNDQIFGELNKLVLLQTSIFVVHMSASFGSKFFLQVKERGMMSEGYVWIITSGMMNVFESLEPNVIASMQGVLGVNPYTPRSERVQNFTTRWKRKFIEDNPDIINTEMVTFGLQAYDTVWALAMAAETVLDMESEFNLDIRGSSIEFLRMEVSKTGPKLLEQISKTKFEGLSGEFRLVNGQLEPAAIQILNILGKELNVNSDQTYSKSAKNFQGIIWPGESTSVPKGWVIPMDGKKLRIGVPVQDGFRELVNVTKDPLTNATLVVGYCIDVFHSAIASLPYTIPYELIPFQREDGKSAGTYNDLIDQVYHRNFDAVVGDITITANRSLYVDFSFPYTEGGVWMIVPLKQQEESLWTSFQSLSQKFGFLSMGVFIITGIVVWVLEQDDRPRFSNILPEIVHLYRAKVISYLSKFMVIIWIILIHGLVSNYMVSLSSMLTLEREPAIMDFNDLIESGDNVGYRQGSFVVDLLKRFHFKESKLKSYSSPQECHELLSKGTKNGGVAAVFDEMPYINIFLAKYRSLSLYTKVGPTHKTDGYGFVFPLGSPIVSDMSNAVLEVTEGKTLMDNAESWYFTNITSKEEIGWAIFSSRNHINHLQIIVSLSVLFLLMASSMFKDKEKRL
ncbi:hypothetical protein ACHQM5_029812 [Ranunculus cassubicifolius]